jgi:hypothetical protein
MLVLLSRLAFCNYMVSYLQFVHVLLKVQRMYKFGSDVKPRGNQYVW